MCIALYRLYRRVNAMWIKCGQFSNLRGGALKSRMSSASMPRWAKAAKPVQKICHPMRPRNRDPPKLFESALSWHLDTVATVASNPLDEATDALCGSFLAQRTELYSWDRLNCIFFVFLAVSTQPAAEPKKKLFTFLKNDSLDFQR